MILENLKDFEWYNEPENVVFKDQEMRIVAAGKTDFWQNTHHRFAKDDGHFFYKRSDGDFSCRVQWKFDQIRPFDQCGLMIRLDAENWLKISAMAVAPGQVEVGTGLTNCGCSDWAGVRQESALPSLWYKVRRVGSDFIASYSTDGENFCVLRRFCFCRGESDLEMMAGAYICCPQGESFAAVLAEIEFF